MEDSICVDTDVIIDHLRGRGPGVLIFENIVKNKKPATTQINKFELLCGIRQEKEIKIIQDCLSGFEILPFDDIAASESAKIYRDLKSKGSLIGIRDIMIAGVAKFHKLPVATNNIKDFKRINGLRIFYI
jgi:predicted nucleic acid-binding protein